MDIYNTSGTGLFNLLAPLFRLGNRLDAVRTGQIAQDWQALQDALDLAPELNSAWQQGTAWQAAAGGWQRQLATAAEGLVLRYVVEKGLPRPRLRDALDIVLDDMSAQAYYCTASTRSIAIQYPIHNGDGAVYLGTHTRLRQQAALLPELITGEFRADQVTLRGQSPRDPTDPQWPGGSGIHLTLPLLTSGDSLLANADFEQVHTDGAPTGWLIHTGTVGSTVHVTTPKSVRIAITGQPTGGYYVLLYTEDGQYETAAIPYNANAAAIQAALRGIERLERVTVSGSNPYTVVLENTVSTAGQLAAVNRLTGGSNPQVTITTLDPGNLGSYRGRSLELRGTGNELTSLWQPVDLLSDTVYAIMFRAARTAQASGRLVCELRRNVTGEVMHSREITIADLPVIDHDYRYGDIGVFFSVANYSAGRASFVIRVTQALPSGQSVYLDNIILAPAQQFYQGGPYAAAVRSRWFGLEDTLSIQVQNDYAAKWEKVFDRWFHLRALAERALPTEGTTLIPDSLLA